MFFENSDFIPHSRLFTRNAPPGMSETLNQLTKDGMLECAQTGYKITLAGKKKISGGGYLREALWGRIIRLSVIVGIAASLLAILL